MNNRDFEVLNFRAIELIDPNFRRLTGSSLLESEFAEEVIEFWVDGKFFEFHVDTSADTSS